MAIGYSPEQKEINYHAVDYSNPDCIKGFLRFYYKLQVEAREKHNWELIAILIDIEYALGKIELTAKQTDVLSYYLDGFTEAEIGGIFGVGQRAISYRIDGIVKKIIKILEKN